MKKRDIKIFDRVKHVGRVYSGITGPGIVVRLYDAGARVDYCVRWPHADCSDPETPGKVILHMYREEIE